jgi:uncharacterized protein (TIGR03382 family)
MGALLRFLGRTGFRRGLAGPGGTGWLAVGAAAALAQRARRKKDEPKVLYTKKLEPGQQMVITHYRKGEAP